MAKSPLTPHQQALIRRYLIWDYKQSREAFERIERKTTQLIVDEYVLSALPSSAGAQEFKNYVEQKRADEIKLKYTGVGKKDLNENYVFLRDRLKAVEGAIRHFLGPKALKEIEALFEVEFTRRILESKDH